MRFSPKLLLLAGLLGLSFLAGYWLRSPGTARQKLTGRRILYYHDPMHPAYKSDKPGVAPDCGMQLEPVYEDGPAAPGEAAKPAAPGSVRLSFDKQQMIGLRTAQAGATSGLHTLRLLGRVTADESRVYKVSALSEGVVRAASSFGTGSMVKKDDLLATYFVAIREVYNAMQNFFMATNNLDRGLSQQADASVVDAARADLRVAEELLNTYGVTGTQLRALAGSRQITRDIEFRAPVDGLILARNVAVGQRLERGAELFRIADLKRVWVLADVYENDSSLIRTGSAARVRYNRQTLPALVGESRQFDAASRTLKVRLELDNPALTLRPDMFVDVEFDVKEPAGISIPVDAVLNSGRGATVFVPSGDGAFVPRTVTTGIRYGDRIQILGGIEAGETVVVSGLFLLDSESRLQMASADSAKPVPTRPGKVADPVCGMEIGEPKTARRSEYRGSTYHFCSEDCKAKFDRNPGQYAAKVQPSATQGGQQ